MRNTNTFITFSYGIECFGRAISDVTKELEEMPLQPWAWALGPLDKTIYPGYIIVPR